MPCVADLADDRHQLADVGRGQAGGRLVEQQQLRIERRARGRSRAGAACRRAGCALPRWPASARPTNSSMLAARSRARRFLAPVARRVRMTRRAQSERKVWCRPTSTFSIAVISPNSCTFWKVRAMPRQRDLRGRAAGDRRARRTSIGAGGRLVDAGEHVHHRALARAVRADQAVDRAARDREVDAGSAPSGRRTASALVLTFSRVARAGRLVRPRRRRHPARRGRLDALTAWVRPIGLTATSCAGSRRCRPAGSRPRTGSSGRRWSGASR